MARHEKPKPQKPMIDDQPKVTEEQKKPIENQRKEKLADFLIDVAKYVFTGVVITSLFNDVSDKTVLYAVGMFIVVLTLTIGLVLTNKKKGN